MITRADHVALCVRDMERVIAFYRDVMGLEKVFDHEYGNEIGRLIGVDETQVRIVHMKRDGAFVELFDYRNLPGREPPPDRKQYDYGLTHIGFIVEDFWATYRHLVGCGVGFLGEPSEVRPGVYVAYFHGAEYEVCEIREIAPPPP